MEHQGQFEYLYVLTNVSLPGIVKIGKTDRSPHKRAKELSAFTGVPTEFTVFRAFQVRDSTSAESRIHERLADYRVSENREFFRIEPEAACAAIEDMLSSDLSKRTSDIGREDELLAQATVLVGKTGRIWPSMIRGQLHISYDEAETIFRILQGRGIIDPEGNQN